MSDAKIAVLGGNSMAADMLAREFSSAGLDAGSAAAPIGVVASGAGVPQALAHVAARPEGVNAVALIAPGAPDKAVSGVTVPVLVLLGTRDANAQATGAAWRKALPGCNVTFVYDASSDMANERPEAVAAALADFLRQREKYVVTDKSAKLYP
jgi:pimeloyl-ACP methyl ester carboxylesterase